MILRVIILFLVIFNFRIPVLYNSTILSIVLCSLYYTVCYRSIPFSYFVKRYQAFILSGLLFTLTITFFYTVVHAQFEFTLVKVLSLQVLMVSALMYALPLLIDEETKHEAFEQATGVVCYAFALQGLIQLLGFLIPPFGEFLVSIKPEGMQVALKGTAYNIYFRGYSLTGSPFFELPAGYGVAFILFFRILLIEGQKIITGYKIYVMFFLFLLGAVFSGRTAFLGFIMALIMSLLIMKNPLGAVTKITVRLFLPIVILTIIYAFFLSEPQRKRLDKEILPFAFEFYYKYKEEGELRTASSDIMFEKHYFSLSHKTLVTGDGRYRGLDGGYYMYTDAGYMRTVLYGGIPFLLLLILYQSLYFIQPLRVARSGTTREDRADYLCFLTLFLHLFILEYKADTIGTQNIMEVLLLFIGTGYMVRNYELGIRNFEF